MPTSVPNEIASQRRVYLSTVSQGKFRIWRVEKFDAKPDGKTEIATEVGNPVGAGFIRKPGGYILSIEGYEQEGVPGTLGGPPDWDALVESQENVTVTDQIDGGARTLYGPARVSSVSRSGDKDGQHSISIEIAAADRSRM